MKKAKGLKNAHTPNTKHGMGDFYGSGIKNPIGKMIDGVGQVTVPKSKLKKPPRTLA